MQERQTGAAAGRGYIKPTEKPVITKQPNGEITVKTKQKTVTVLPGNIIKKIEWHDRPVKTADHYRYDTEGSISEVRTYIGGRLAEKVIYSEGKPSLIYHYDGNGNVTLSSF